MDNNIKYKQMIPKDMKKYKYVVIRYVPDFATDEFINAGIIVYDMDKNEIRSKLVDDTSRFECIDPDADYDFFMRIANDIVDEIENRIKKLKQTDNVLLTKIIEKSFYAIVQPDPGILSFSDIKGGITQNIDKQLETLYHEYIGAKIIKKPHRKETSRRNYAVTNVYRMIDKIKDRLIKKPEQKSFYYGVTEKQYPFEVSFNERDNVYLKVLSLRTSHNNPSEVSNIFSAIPILSDFKKEYKDYTFGGIFYFHPKYNHKAQEKEFERFQKRFSDEALDCIKAEEKEMLQYFSAKKLAKNPSGLRG